MDIFQHISARFHRQTTRTVRRDIERLCANITALEPALSPLSDEVLQVRAGQIRRQVAAGASLDAVLVEAFAVAREAAKRVLGQRPFDAQVMGGIALHNGKIAEMKTGEGKTLAATMPVYLNALAGKGVHVSTINDYLAARDAAWMGDIYRFLGLSVGVVTSTTPRSERRPAYDADVTYAVHTELAFDYLKDNMCMSLDDRVQRPLDFAIVDEIDAVLIDEARTPIELMTPSEATPDVCYAVDAVIRKLDPELVDRDDKRRKVTLTEAGFDEIERLLKEAGLIAKGGLYDLENLHFVSLVGQALHAHHLLHRDKDYVIKDGDVVLVDEVRGRMIVGRRLAGGLHEALEAKEGLALRQQGVVVAQTSYQNYFRLYRKLAGMTGTALTDADEFLGVYNLQVVEVPTNKPMIRVDHQDEVYQTEVAKIDAMIRRVVESRDRGQPVMIGTTSVGKSEMVSTALARVGVAHEVLNARQHEREAEIIAQAGRPGAVTVATNMAGRGTDIQLGGNADFQVARELAGVTGAEERAKRAAAITREIDAARAAVRNAGGLLIIGTERHFCRRIDNQLIGRGGRQGDPGDTVFMLSLDDELITVFGDARRLKRRLAKLGLAEGTHLFHTWLTRAIRKAQSKLEEVFVESRQFVLDYDDVAHEQRKLVYQMRRELLASDALDQSIAAMRSEVLAALVGRAMPPEAYPEQWDMRLLAAEMRDKFNLLLPLDRWAAEEGIGSAEMERRIGGVIEDHWFQRRALFVPSEFARIVRYLHLTALDECWREHLAALDDLRFGVMLRGAAQLEPLHEYKREAFDFFAIMLTRFCEKVVVATSRMEPVSVAATGTFKAVHVKRLQPCPCGSGRRYKDCHGRGGSGREIPRIAAPTAASDAATTEMVHSS
ncbi:MAG: preprotein translocase subunit SecA [Proteobacteria bacterium]|nr:preprotein translocase subunit SecA [Pseudomonadota bacterium]